MLLVCVPPCLCGRWRSVKHTLREKKMDMNRRKFLASTATLAMAAGTMVKTKAAHGANSRIGICVIGLNGRGHEHMQAFQKVDGAEVVALCDADDRVLSARVEEYKSRYGKTPKAFKDMREAMKDPDIHAVSIATPNHWHTLAAIWGLQAGKHVYVEKPATHEIWEGRQLIAAAKKYGKVLQHGTQRRSEAIWMRDIKLLQSGEIIGPVYYARGLCYKNGNRGPVKDTPDQEPPKELDWRLWQGPASERPFNPQYHPYTWHWFWHYGNGEIGNQGIHQMDVGAWGMNRGFPTEVYSMGGRYTYTDKAETPNTNVATFKYEDGSMFVFEVRSRFTQDEGGVKVGNLFYADGGYYVEDKGFFDTKDKPIEVDESKYPKPDSKGNWQNFIDAINSGKEEDIHGNAYDGHISSGHSHLANISYRLGRSLKFDPKTETFVGDDEANKLLKREYAPGFEVPELA